MLQLNHLCSLLLQRHSLLHLQTPLMMLIWILRPEASGVGARMHILMLGCFTQMPPATAPLALNLLINVMRMPRSVNMVTELGILNMVFLPHWCFLQLGAWGVRSLFSTDAWLICLQLIGDRITARLLVG